VKDKMNRLFGNPDKGIYIDTDTIGNNHSNVDYWLKVLENPNLDDYSKELVNRVIRKEIRILMKPVIRGGMFNGE
jgi:hypothetical protein